ncbi:hypothetical protein BN1200_820013 [Klebsiella variicola]|nr:hypothetical protein BN1200_820013 [Klebsiella variicola]
MSIRKFLINKTLSICLLGFFTDNYFFIFAVHKNLVLCRLLLKLEEDKTTGSMRYL